jgi:hypothetical protein
MVFFISGDRHLAELMKIPKSIFGYETYELTTSAIHASVYPSSWDKTPNPNQIEGTAGSWNYVIMDTLSLPGKLGLHLNVFGPNQKILLKKDLEIRK